MNTYLIISGISLVALIFVMNLDFENAKF